MSFRTRLTWFFIVIVIVPMVAVAVVLFRLVADSERGKSDARLSQAQTAASAVFEESAQRAAEAGRQIAESRALAAALDDGGARAIRRELQRLAARSRAVRAVMVLDRGPSFSVGDKLAVAPAGTALIGQAGDRIGTLRTAVITAADFGRLVSRYTGLETAVTAGSRTVASTLPGLDAAGLPRRGETEVGGRRYRFTSFTAPGFDEGDRVTVRLLGDERDTKSAVTEDSVLVAGLLIAFLGLAFAFALTVSRSLQAQIGRLLEAARRLGGGELAVQVPTEGNDEFAALGSEFNAMARQLEARLEDLRTERARLQHAIRRVGESFAKGLDRNALLDIVVQTAVDGVGADAGRATVRDFDGGPFAERARAGDVPALRRALHAAESAVLDVREPAEVVLGEAHALAHPLKASEREGRVMGIVSIAREGRAFSDAEQDLFNYLASQSAVSIENVDLHETVQRQAVTDELTGLSNHRRFQEVMAIEVERAKRFGLSLGLIMLDIDDFKSVNDTYGHLQGDLVLREVARVLRETCREIDEPARYGGEEMAVALPETDLDGAARFADRLRRRIEALEVPRIDGAAGGPVQVTASFGAAAFPESAERDKDALVAAADGALYRAKRLGKNRVVEAG